MSQTMKLIFFSEERQLKKLIRPYSNESCGFINLREHSSNPSLPPHFRKYKLDILIDSREREEIRNTFTEKIGEMNTKNHSLEWWAYSFTCKHPLATPLYSRIFFCIAINKLFYKL